MQASQRIQNKLLRNLALEGYLFPITNIRYKILSNILINHNCYEEIFIVLIKRKKKRWNVALFYDFLSEGEGGLPLCAANFSVCHKKRIKSRGRTLIRVPWALRPCQVGFQFTMEQRRKFTSPAQRLSAAKKRRLKRLRYKMGLYESHKIFILLKNNCTWDIYTETHTCINT